MVNAAPTQQSIDLNLFDVLGNLEDFRANIQCISNVVDGVLDESALDDLWHDAKIQLKSIVEVEWHNCLDKNDDTEQEK